MKTKVLLIALIVGIGLDALARHRAFRNYHPGETTRVYINPKNCYDSTPIEYRCNDVRFVPQTLNAREANGR